MNVLQMKFVALFLAVALHEKNVNPYVIQAIVLQVLTAQPEIIESHAPVDIL
jgi:hypothetical protein